MSDLYNTIISEINRCIGENHKEFYHEPPAVSSAFAHDATGVSEQLELLRQENELLRKRVRQLREETARHPE